MANTTDRTLVHRFRAGVPLVLFLCLVLVAGLPVAAEGLASSVDASMIVSQSEASPHDPVTFWISIDHVGEEVQTLVITEAPPQGLAILSAIAPKSCMVTNWTWVCDQNSWKPFAIEVHVVVGSATEGQNLTNLAWISVRHDQEDQTVARVSAGISIVPAKAVGFPQLSVRVLASQGIVIPGTELNYRIQLTNNGTAAANNISIAVSMPTAMVLTSAAPLPESQAGALRWTLDSLPVRSVDFLFNMTLPPANSLDHVQVAVAVTYGDGSGGQVRVEGLPSTLGVIPTTAAPGSAIPIPLFVAVVALIGGALLIAQRTVGLPLVGRSGAEEIFLLHRSGLVLKHFSAHPSTERDSDIVGGMMAAVQMFVEDSVRPFAGPLREIRFHGGNVVFVNGHNVTLAAVNPRGRGTQFADRARRFLQEFERTNGDALMNFDGEAGGLDGVDALVRRFAGGPGSPGRRTGSPEGDVPRQ